MDVGSIQSQLATFSDENVVNKNITNSPVFDVIYNAAMDAVKNTNNQILDLENMQMLVASGQSDDILSLTLAQSKAYTSFQFLVNASNKAVEAYREIMRIQI